MKILGFVSIILLVCTLICGLWIRSNPVTDIGFHFTLSIASVVLALITIILFMITNK